MESPYEPQFRVQTGPLQCPRCGYLLDATIEASEARGEPEGRCSECALPIRWEDLREDSTNPTWFVESRKRRLGLFVRSAVTFLRCYWPPTFWGRIPLGLPFAPRGMLAFALALAIAAHMIAFVARLEINARSWNPWPTTTADRVVAFLTPLNQTRGQQIMAALGELPKDAGAVQKATHVFRRFLYSIDPTGLVVPPSTRWQTRFPSPALVDPVTSDRLLSAACVPILAPCCLLVLRISLRRARIRPVHILRGVVYSLALLLPLLICAIVVGHSRWPVYIGTQDTIGRMKPHVLTIFAAAITLPWFWAYVARYLRIPNAWGVAAACTAIATLLSLLVSAAQFGRV